MEKAYLEISVMSTEISRLLIPSSSREKPVHSSLSIVPWGGGWVDSCYLLRVNA
jgi:hypothetical protein